MKSDLRPDPSPGIDKALTFADPKGTLIEVFTAAKPFARRPPPSGVGPFKLGHLAFSVDDPKAFADFYGRVLGFRVSDWIEDWFVFMRCGPDHHTVNFVHGQDHAHASHRVRAQGLGARADRMRLPRRAGHSRSSGGRGGTGRATTSSPITATRTTRSSSCSPSSTR